MFKMFGRGFNQGMHFGLYEQNPGKFIRLIRPHVTISLGRDDKALELLSLAAGIQVEKQLELLEDEINAAIEANGGIKNTILELNRQ